MARQAPRSLFTVLGLVIWGDFADLTMYKATAGHLVVFRKTWPDKPASDKQLSWRAEWSAAAAAWNQLPSPAQHQWELASRRASLCATGYNLFLFFTLSPDALALATLERQTKTQLQLTP